MYNQTLLKFSLLSFSISDIQFGNHILQCGLRKLTRKNGLWASTSGILPSLPMYKWQIALSSWQPCRRDPAQSPVWLPFMYCHNDKDLWRSRWSYAMPALTLFSAVREERVLLAVRGRPALLPGPYLWLPCTTGTEDSKLWLEYAQGENLCLWC